MSKSGRASSRRLGSWFAEKRSARPSSSRRSLESPKSILAATGSETPTIKDSTTPIADSSPYAPDVSPLKSGIGAGLDRAADDSCDDVDEDDSLSDPAYGISLARARATRDRQSVQTAPTLSRRTSSTRSATGRNSGQSGSLRSPVRKPPLSTGLSRELNHCWIEDDTRVARL